MYVHKIIYSILQIEHSKNITIIKTYKRLQVNTLFTSIFITPITVFETLLNIHTIILTLCITEFYCL